MPFNIPDTNLKRVIIVGAGFGGLTLARKLKKYPFQVVLIDRNNFHQFQPLFYQVAMSGLEPSSISFPLRKIFWGAENVFNRIAEVNRIDSTNNKIYSSLGELKYDYLIIATGAITNFFNNEEISRNVIPMKSVSEALYLRNKILEDYEKAVTSDTNEQSELLTDVVIVGGGPTGVELAGSLAEMRNDILPKEFKEINAKKIEIYLIHGGNELLQGMDVRSGAKAEYYLKKMGVNVVKNTFVKRYDGNKVLTDDGKTIKTNKVIWAAGIIGRPLIGLSNEIIGQGNRIKIDSYCRVISSQNIYALGDVALLIDKDYPKGYPQVAQVAIQQGKLIAQNFIYNLENKQCKEFKYKDLGTMATIGRFRAVVDLPFIHFSGYFAWLTWLFVHLFSLLGLRNKIIVTINWFWSYISYGQSLRLIIKPRIVKNDEIVKDV